MRRAFVYVVGGFAMIGLAMMTQAADDKKDPEKLPKPWEEVVQVRRYITQNKEGEKLLNPVECYAFRKDVKGETVMHVKDAAPKGEPNFIDVGSEITDEKKVVWVVTKYQKNLPDANIPHRCTVKKKDPQPKK